MENVMSAFKIRTREAAEYTAQGYYVITNTSIAHVQITEEGLHLDVGATMAIKEFGPLCEKAKNKNLIKVLGTPQEVAKKDKKRSTEPAPTPTEVTPTVPSSQQEAVSVSAEPALLDDPIDTLSNESTEI